MAKLLINMYFLYYLGSTPIKVSNHSAATYQKNVDQTIRSQTLRNFQKKLRCLGTLKAINQNKFEAISRNIKLVRYFSSLRMF